MPTTIAVLKRAPYLLAAFLCTVMALPSQAAPQPKPSILLGAAWYPEQWPESRWEADLQLMQDAHLHVVRVGEFAWSTMEPAEGRFEFTWLDRAITMAAKHNIAVVLGTPTAAPPAWLTTKYPETLKIEDDGRRAEHGNRAQFSFTSIRYRFFARRVAEQMAVRYGHNPNVIGWQIDNEIAAPSFDPASRVAFHAWLQHRYQTIAELNRRWTTSYWSQTYDTFSQIPMRSSNEHPALLLDLKRFQTETWVSYLDNQSQVIRAHADRRQFITTNTMGFNESFDHYAIHKNLDIAAWDDYAGNGHLDPHLNAFLHDLVRGFKDKNFWLMETQPGFVNWNDINRALDRGVVREMAWQAIAHGADAILYWQWRSALNGQEEYHGTLVGADGTPMPVYSEVKQLGEELEHAGEVFNGTTPRNGVAIINDYDSRWAIDFQRHNRNFDYAPLMQSWYKAIEPLSAGIDIVSSTVPLERYKIVFAPALNVLPEATAQHLRAYVMGGGTLVLGPRSGMKDVDNALNTQRQPGPLTELLGANVAQFYALDAPVPVAGNHLSGNATIWAEQLTPNAADTKTLLTYGTANSWLDGKPAVVSRRVGNGSIVYVGAWMDADLTRSLFSSFLTEAHAPKPAFAVPEGVELAERSSESSVIYMLLNHTAKVQTVSVPSGLRNVLELSSGGPVTLPPHGVVVLMKMQSRATQ